ASCSDDDVGHPLTSVVMGRKIRLVALVPRVVFSLHMAQISTPAEATVRQNSPRFALQDLPVPMVYATYRIIRDCNAAFASLFGAAREEIIGGSFARLYPEIDDFVRRGRQWASQFGEQGTYYDE